MATAMDERKGEPLEVLCVTALPEEATALKACFRNSGRWEQLAERPAASSSSTGPNAGPGPDREVFCGRLGGVGVRAVCAGAGRVTAQRRVRAELELCRPDLLLGVGVAGALSPDLTLQDVIVARTVLDLAEPQEAEASGRVEGKKEGFVPEHLAALEGSLLTVGTVITDPVQRQELWRQLCLEEGIDKRAAVDMESSAWVAEADRFGVRWSVVRAVSDRSDHRLPAYLERCVRTDGSVDRVAVARAAVVRPWTIAPLLRLGRNSGDAAANAAAIAVRLLQTAADSEETTHG